MFLLNRNRFFLKHLTTRCISKSYPSAIKTKQNKTDLTGTKDSNSIKRRQNITEEEIQKIINLDNIHIVTKKQTKLPERPPLVENFFIGTADRELFPYPQVIDIDDYNKLIEKLEPINSFFAEKSKTAKDPTTKDISKELLIDLQRMKLLGTSISQQFGGLGYFVSETAYASECEANDVKLALILGGHRLVAEAILNHGTVEQHNKYLMDMAKGNVIGSVCLQEPHLNQDESIRAVLNISGKNEHWILNGSKSFVIHSTHSNLLLVMAETFEESEYNNVESKNKMIAILVDPKTRGITISNENRNRIGCDEVPYCTINFSNVHVSAGNVLSLTTDGCDASTKLVRSSRIQSAILNAIQIKKILNYLVQYTIDAEYNAEKLLNIPFIRKYLSISSCDLYALESMIYMTAGIIDAYENPKVDLESSIVKAYSQECLLKISRAALNFFDHAVTTKGHPIEEDIRNAIQLQYHGESTQALKSYIGLAGLNHSNNVFGGRVRSFKDTWFRRWSEIPTVEFLSEHLFLDEYVHPTLSVSAVELEDSILRLRCGTEMLLHRHGANVIERKLDILTLGETAIQCYAMFASLSRASRSYCIGLRYSVHETVIAASIVGTTTDEILKRMLEIKHETKEHDTFHQEVVEYVLKNKNSNMWQSPISAKGSVPPAT